MEDRRQDAWWGYATCIWSRCVPTSLSNSTCTCHGWHSLSFWNTPWQQKEGWTTGHNEGEAHCVQRCIYRVELEMWHALTVNILVRLWSHGAAHGKKVIAGCIHPNSLFITLVATFWHLPTSLTEQASWHVEPMLPSPCLILERWSVKGFNSSSGVKFDDTGAGYIINRRIWPTLSIVPFDFWVPWLLLLRKENMHVELLQCVWSVKSLSRIEFS